MENILENQFTLTKDTYKEYYRMIYFKAPLIATLDLLLALNFVCVIIELCVSKNLFDVNI